ncbi:MAG TPA: c-type cytochrome [Gemmatimonadales bacterium]|nr:c-type cytochrome [Gemmatimonadales bacterium]
MRRLDVLVAATAIVLLGGAAPLAAQVPDSFTNLKVLPKNISREQLDRVMDSFTEGLGVRCDFCHVRDTTKLVRGRPRMDFASDKKDHKKTARVMLRMVQDINAKYLTQLEGGSDIHVQCFTCHHGNKTPERLENVLFAAYLGGGPDSVATAYRNLREQYYGRAIYDFGEGTLIATARMIAQVPNRTNNLPAAIAVLDLNTSYFPKSVATLANIAFIYARAGDTTKAIAAMTQAQGLEPDNPQLARMLQRLKGH